MQYIENDSIILSVKCCNRCHESKLIYNYYPRSGICKECQKKSCNEKKQKDTGFLPKLRLVPFFKPKLSKYV